MNGQTISGLFRDPAHGEKALAELQAAQFANAQISEVSESEQEPYAAQKRDNPVTDFFSDHTATGTEFRDTLIKLGISSQDAQYFEDAVARGAVLVTVKADERASEAVAILQRNGADLGSLGRKVSNISQAQNAQNAMNAQDLQGAQDAQKLQLREERLAIDKIRVASGAVRVRKQVITEQQSIDVPVLREELVIERHAVPEGVSSGTIGSDETITIPLSHEEVKVAKQTVVTQEVEIGKRVITGTEHVSEETRREELVADEEGKPAGR